jgi:sporulation protein YlmC with PRC-barrel domain
MMRMSAAVGRRVVSTANAATVGKISEFIVDPQTRTIVALRLKKAESGDTLAWADIEAFGPDAVTVRDSASVVEASPDVAALSGKPHRFLGKRVLTTTGDEAGILDDVEFDPESGLVTALIVGNEDLLGEKLRGIGSYAVVVAVD